MTASSRPPSRNWGRNTWSGCNPRSASGSLARDLCRPSGGKGGVVPRSARAAISGANRSRPRSWLWLCPPRSGATSVGATAASGACVRALRPCRYIPPTATTTRRNPIRKSGCWSSGRVENRNRPSTGWRRYRPKPSARSWSSSASAAGSLTETAMPTGFRPRGSPGAPRAA